LRRSCNDLPAALFLRDKAGVALRYEATARGHARAACPIPRYRNGDVANLTKSHDCNADPAPNCAVNAKPFNIKTGNCFSPRPPGAAADMGQNARINPLISVKANGHCSALEGELPLTISSRRGERTCNSSGSTSQREHIQMNRIKLLLGPMRVPLVI